MRILSRYILKEISSHSLLGLLVFTFVIFIRHLGHLLELVVRHNLPLPDMMTLFLLPVPGILVLTVPMAVLVGTLIGLSRMAADGEVIAARASGIGISQFVRPVLLFASAGCALALWMSLFLSPQAARKLNRMEAGLRASQVSYEIQPRVFIEQFPNLLLYLQDVTGTRFWRGVFIVDTTQRDQVKVTLAESGVLVNEAANGRLVIHLAQGMTHEIDSPNSTQYSVASFTDTDIPVPLEQGTAAESESQSPQLLSLHRLMKQTHSARERQAALVELHYRFALPVASFVLALVGISLGLSTRKGGKAVGLILTILLVFLYYMIMAFGISFAKQGRLPPVIGLWLANVIFAAGGVLMLAQNQSLRLRLQFLQDWMDDFEKSWQARPARRWPASGRGSRRGSPAPARTTRRQC